MSISALLFSRRWLLTWNRAQLCPTAGLCLGDTFSSGFSAAGSRLLQAGGTWLAAFRDSGSYSCTKGNSTGVCHSFQLPAPQPVVASSWGSRESRVWRYEKHLGVKLSAQIQDQNVEKNSSQNKEDLMCSENEMLEPSSYLDWYPAS